MKNLKTLRLMSIAITVGLTACNSGGTNTRGNTDISAITVNLRNKVK